MYRVFSGHSHFIFYNNNNNNSILGSAAWILFLHFAQLGTISCITNLPKERTQIFVCFHAKHWLVMSHMHIPQITIQNLKNMESLPKLCKVNILSTWSRQTSSFLTQINEAKFCFIADVWYLFLIQCVFLFLYWFFDPFSSLLSHCTRFRLSMFDLRGTCWLKLIADVL